MPDRPDGTTIMSRGASGSRGISRTVSRLTVAAGRQTTCKDNKKLRQRRRRRRSRCTHDKPGAMIETTINIILLGDVSTIIPKTDMTHHPDRRNKHDSRPPTQVRQPTDRPITTYVRPIHMFGDSTADNDIFVRETRSAADRRQKYDSRPTAQSRQPTERKTTTAGQRQNGGNRPTDCHPLPPPKKKTH